MPLPGCQNFVTQILRCGKTAVSYINYSRNKCWQWLHTPPTLSQLLATAADIWLIDLRFGEMSELNSREALPESRMLLTGFVSIATAVQAVKLGADDYLTNPLILQCDYRQ